MARSSLTPSMHCLLRLLPTACVALLFGCNTLGPAAVESARSPYNVAIQRTNDEQLLLNLVRLRYRDTPCFLEVTSITTTHDVSGNLGGGGAFPTGSSPTWTFSGSAGYSERPTVSYSQLQGMDFVTKLMTPVKLDTLILLYHSGWSVERVFRLCLQRINKVPNAPTASGPTPEDAPDYEAFDEVVRLLRDLQKRELVTSGSVSKEPREGNGLMESRVELRFDGEGLDDPAVRRLYELLNLDRTRMSFPLEANADVSGRDRIGLVPRSMLACLYYVSQGVEVPEEDERAGRVTVTRNADGSVFDWTGVTGRLLRIHASPSRPQNAYTTVHYRNHWFYIDDRDLNTKSTFSLLTQMFALRAGNIESVAPALTVPVR